MRNFLQQAVNADVAKQDITNPLRARAKGFILDLRARIATRGFGRSFAYALLFGVFFYE